LLVIVSSLVMGIGIVVGIRDQVLNDWTRSQRSVHSYVTAHQESLTKRANAVLHDPSAKTEGSQLGDEWVAQGDDAPIYARVDALAIPAKAYGLVYDPHHQLELGVPEADLIRDCSRVRARWFWCQVY
jgi:hypothetical protein